MANPGAYGVGRPFTIPIEIDFPRRVAFGQIPGASIVTIMGHNGDIDAGTVPEDIWEGGGVYPFQSAAVSLELVSTDIDDTAAGTGARTIRVETLDGNYSPVTQTVTMNGTTPVALTGTHLRVNKVQVITSGTSETNEGVITLRVPGPGDTLAVIDNNGGVVGDGIAHNGIYTVPSGFRFLFIYNHVNILKTATDNAQILFRIRPFGESWRVANQWGPASTGGSSVSSESPATPMQSEKTDIRYTVSSVSANNIGVNCFGVGLLIPNSFFRG